MSAGTNYTIRSTSPTQLFLEKSNDCFIYNTGTTTVYLDSDPGGTTNTGMPLPPSSSKTWLAGSRCYAITASPDIATLNVTDNAGEVVNPAAIATSLLNSGLAQAIASAIFITGAPPVDKYTVLDNSGFFSTSYTSNQFDVSNYQSLVLNIGNGFPNHEYLFVTVEWWDGTIASGGSVISQDSCVTCSGGENYTRFTVPVSGPLARVVINGPVFNNYSVKTYGSFKSVASIKYTSSGFGASAGTVDGQGSPGSPEPSWNGVQDWFGTLAAGATETWQPDITAGPTRLCMGFNGTTPSSSLIVGGVSAVGAYGQAILQRDAAVVSVNAAVRFYDMHIPPMPIGISLTNAGANVFDYRLTWLPTNPYSS